MTKNPVSFFSDATQKPRNVRRLFRQSASGLRRRTFLDQLGAVGAFVTILPHGSKAASTSSAAAADAAAGGATRMDFCAMLGDHDWWHHPRGTNPNYATVFYCEITEVAD